MLLVFSFSPAWANRTSDYSTWERVDGNVWVIIDTLELRKLLKELASNFELEILEKGAPYQGKEIGLYKWALLLRSENKTTEELMKELSSVPYIESIFPGYVNPPYAEGKVWVYLEITDPAAVQVIVDELLVLTNSELRELRILSEMTTFGLQSYDKSTDEVLKELSSVSYIKEVIPVELWDTAKYGADGPNGTDDPKKQPETGTQPEAEAQFTSTNDGGGCNAAGYGVISLLSIALSFAIIGKKN